jgi:hypothetical protein
MLQLVEFAFIVAVPLLLVGAGLVGLFAVGALFDALEDPQGLARRIDGIFRRPAKPAKAAGKDHYYQPFWVSR